MEKNPFVNPSVVDVELKFVFTVNGNANDDLLLKFVQSVDERRPSDETEAVGIFNVCVEPLDVNPNPPLSDDVAKV